MNRSILETALGAIVLAVAAIFLVFAYSSAKISSGSGYELTARFNSISGIRAGGDVELSGIKVGNIVSATLDPKTYQAIVKLNIDNDVKVPDDSQAVITSSSLLGDNFLSLVPGGSDTMLAAGGIIKFTQAPASLQSLLGQVVFSLTQSKTGGSGSAAPDASSPATPAPAAPRLPPLRHPLSIRPCGRETAGQSREAAR